MKKITSVEINLTKSGAGSVSPRFRCRSVVSLDKAGVEVQDHLDLVGSAEYRSKHELILNVAYRIGVDTSVVSIVN